MHFHMQPLTSQNKSTTGGINIQKLMCFSGAGCAGRLCGACRLLCWLFPPLHVGVRQRGYKSTPPGAVTAAHRFFFF